MERRGGTTHSGTTIRTTRCTSAALTAALFLLVLLLVEGWRIEPLEAAVIVSAMPVAAFAAPRVGVRGVLPEAAIGSLLVAGGLWWAAFNYLIDFRNRGIFYEAVTNQILDDLVDLTSAQSSERRAFANRAATSLVVNGP